MPSTRWCSPRTGGEAPWVLLARSPLCVARLQVSQADEQCTVPWGAASDGQPIGVTFVGRRYAENTLVGLMCVVDGDQLMIGRRVSVCFPLVLWLPCSWLWRGWHWQRKSVVPCMGFNLLQHLAVTMMHSVCPFERVPWHCH